MAEFRNQDDINTGIAGNRTPAGTSGAWQNEENFWRDNWTARPYAQGDRGFDYYRPGYRYGYEAAGRFTGRDWNDVEPELRSEWSSYEGRGQSTWEDMKEAVRDAWNRVTGK